VIKSFAPGKLYIAGEYAVVTPPQPAILAAVNRFIKVSLKEAKGEGSVAASRKQPIKWQRTKDGLITNSSDPFFTYILETIRVFEGYAKELGIPLIYYDLEAESELETPAGVKYGLGSSAAVITATLKALSKIYELALNNEKLFKLASLVQLGINENTSCGDLAASAYGGWLKYTKFFKAWVLRKKEDLPLPELLEKEWPGLSIEHLKEPPNLKLLVGWTGKPASSLGLVSKMKERKAADSAAFADFLSQSKECVRQMAAAFKNGDVAEIQRQLKINRQLLLKLSNDLEMEMETPLLKKFSDLAEKQGGSAKFSGAGGGDCGIAVFKKADKTDDLIHKWSKIGITHLPLEVYEGADD